MVARYGLNLTHSKFTVQGFASGLLSFFGHSPTFAVRDFAGTLAFASVAIDSMRLHLTIKADGLELVDRVSAADREEIETRMHTEVLETATYPEITFEATVVSSERVLPGRYRLRLNGPLVLHGVTRDHQVDLELLIFDDGLRLRSESPLRLSEYRIRPVTALAGAIRLKDELKVAFELVALPEES
jgi:polyisoprenoid-binding protein YceI